MNEPTRGLLTEDQAAYYVGRPASTIRRWAAEGRINRYGRPKRGQVRYHFSELHRAERDEWTRALIKPGDTPPLPHNRSKAAAA